MDLEKIYDNQIAPLKGLEPMSRATNEWHRPYWWKVTRLLGKYLGVRHIDACFEIKVQDCWIGVYWEHRHIYEHVHSLHIWICLLPIFPLHIIVNYVKQG